VRTTGCADYRRRCGGSHTIAAILAALSAMAVGTVGYATPVIGGAEIGYDNERGKGDHRHFHGAETEYAFSFVI
jgi:hypothetical protein